MWSPKTGSSGLFHLHRLPVWAVTSHLSERWMTSIVILCVWIFCYLCVCVWLVFSTICADPVSHSNIRDTSQSFTSACSCYPRLGCQDWLRLTVELAMNSERDWYTQTHTHTHTHTHTTHTHTHTHTHTQAWCGGYWEGRTYVTLFASHMLTGDGTWSIGF